MEDKQVHSIKRRQIIYGYNVSKAKRKCVMWLPTCAFSPNIVGVDHVSCVGCGRNADKPVI